MDEEKKKQLNDAIAVIKAFCFEYDFCSDCPFGVYKSDGYYCDFIFNWQDIK